jgi:ketosteroid isomerase-like protein
MKIALAGCVFGILAFGSANGASAEGSAGEIEKSVAGLEKQWAEAERANKADLIAPLIADKFIITQSDGQVFDRAAFLAEERSLQYSSSDIDDLKVRTFGDTAIAGYELHQKYTSKGKAVDVLTRQTDTWVRMPNGTWQCVAAHGSKMKGK